MKEMERAEGYSSERCSEEYFEVNSCDIEHITMRDLGSDRPNGRSDYHMLYVEHGVCHLFLDGEWKRAPEGSIIIYRPYEPQKYRYFRDDQAISHYVHFTGIGCDSILKRLGIDGVKIFHMGRSASFEAASKRLVREFSLRKTFYGDWCAAYLYEMLNIVARKYALRKNKITQKNEGRITDACNIIYERIGNPPSCDELARMCYLSKSRFEHLFKDVMGQSLNEYINSVRIERAKEMLTSTVTPIADIAEMLGFSNQNYFSRCFRKTVGYSPRDYRATHSL